jgi:hypothetical protein
VCVGRQKNEKKNFGGKNGFFLLEEKRTELCSSCADAILFMLHL